MAGVYPKKLGIICRIFKKINEALRQGQNHHALFENRVLLHGQSGTGKTMVTHKIIEETGSKLFDIDTVYCFRDGYNGVPADALEQRFGEAIAWTKDHRQTAVIMINMMDSLFCMVQIPCLIQLLR